MDDDLTPEQIEEFLDAATHDPDLGPAVREAFQSLIPRAVRLLYQTLSASRDDSAKAEAARRLRAWGFDPYCVENRFLDDETLIATAQAGAAVMN